MQTIPRLSSGVWWLLGLFAVLVTNGVSAQNDGQISGLKPKEERPGGLTAYRIILAPHSGSDKLDVQIRKAQESLRGAADPRVQLERLGWLFVAKARESHNDGFYKLAEQCAVAMQAQDANSPDGLLLRAHVAQSLHRFKEAETLGRQLVARRDLAFDHGVLGDALADQGKLSEAVDHYQRMVDLRPDLQSYCRVAHMRWLKGDLSGAIEAARLAASAGSAADGESSAWAWTRLASYLFQAGEVPDAESACNAALDLVKDYLPALLLKGRMLLAARRYEEAAVTLRRAEENNSLPEYQWALAEALREAGKAEEASVVEDKIKRHGAGMDPRTLALFLATRGEQTNLTLRLAERELDDRKDVHTHDALAWALFVAGRHVDAWKSMERALAEGTKDARLFLHAAVIAARIGREDATSWLARARELERLLLPSERRWLAQSIALNR